MKRTRILPPRPTQAELDILGVLWRRGPSSVREVVDALSHRKTSGYTTILKLLQIMTEKGLVQRDERQRSHVYEATREREDTQRQLLDDLLERAFEGSAGRLVMQALASRRASPEELAEIRALLERLEGGETR